MFWAILIVTLWIFLNFGFLFYKWLQSVLIPKSQEIHAIDLRKNKYEIGKIISICVVKANPFKNIWFGHIWIVWPEAPPLANGECEAGFYAHCRFEAAINLAISIISPLAIFFGQKPIKGIMRDDKGLHRDFQLNIQIDEECYQKAIQIDNLWRQEAKYCLRPPIGGQTISCRDYCFQIAQPFGLNVRFDKWADFPPISFHNFLIENKIIEKKKLRPSISFFKFDKLRLATN